MPITRNFTPYVLYDTGLVQYSQLSLNGHLYKTDTSIKPTPRVGPCLSLLPLFDFLQDGHLSKTDG